MTPIRVGTCSWADDALVKHWYPKGVTAKGRLPWYAEHFSTAEVDSTFYRVPDEKMVQGWADRTPPGFVMHVKAFGLMTRHPVRLEQVPPDLREGMPVDGRGRVDRPPRELRGRVVEVFVLVGVQRFYQLLDGLHLVLRHFAVLVFVNVLE